MWFAGRCRSSKPDDVMDTVKLAYNGTQGFLLATDTDHEGKTGPPCASSQSVRGEACLQFIVIPRLETDDATIYCCDSHLPRQMIADLHFRS